MPNSAILSYLEGYGLPEAEIPLSGRWLEPGRADAINAILGAIGTGARVEPKIPDIEMQLPGTD
jgi:hypothetical protein